MTSYCWGCMEGIANQEAHYGGCLRDPINTDPYINTIDDLINDLVEAKITYIRTGRMIPSREVNELIRMKNVYINMGRNLDPDFTHDNL